MIYERIDLYGYFNLPRNNNEEGYLISYAHHPTEEVPTKARPAMLIMPGGGYWMRSDREGEPVALAMLQEGYSAFVLEYTVQTCFPTPLLEACMAMVYLRENAERYCVNKEKIAAMGFSAGGHLTTMLATLFACDEVKEALGEKCVTLTRPDAVVLCYPVASLKEGITHAGTKGFITKNGEIAWEKLSGEYNVTEDSSPAFIWHTVGDGCVPMGSSLALATAYKQKNVPFAYHLFELGYHGLSLCEERVTSAEGRDPKMLAEVGAWVPLMFTWLKNRGFTVREKKQEQ